MFSKPPHITRAILVPALTIALAGCGGSSSKQNAAALQRCEQQGSSKSVCQCALAYAEALGDSADKLTREMANGTAITDPAAVKAAVLCAGR